MLTERPMKLGEVQIAMTTSRTTRRRRGASGNDDAGLIWLMIYHTCIHTVLNRSQESFMPEKLNCDSPEREKSKVELDGWNWGRGSQSPSSVHDSWEFLGGFGEDVEKVLVVLWLSLRRSTMAGTATMSLRRCAERAPELRWARQRSRRLAARERMKSKGEIFGMVRRVWNVEEIGLAKTGR